MAFGDIHGRARVDPTAPRAFGVCDDCGTWHNLSELQWQLDYRGNSLQRTGYRKCWRCINVPQPQLKPVILPPDPVPVYQPRIEGFASDNGLQGFTQYTLQPSYDPPTDKTDVLAAIAALSGIATPGGLIDLSNTITAAAAAQTFVPAGAKSYLLLYSPVSAPFGVSFGTAAFNAISTIALGSGGALLWATAQGYGVPNPSAMTIICDIVGQPFYAWYTP